MPEIAKRFINEKLSLHWQIDETEESFRRLMYHLELTSNFKPYFEKAIKAVQFNDERIKTGIIVADIGAGVCWTSAILAKLNYVKHVYAVEPSSERLKHSKFVIDHFNVPREKITISSGSFNNFKISSMVDLFILCGSIHHCYSQDIPHLFENIRKLLKYNGKVLIANEHYVGFIWRCKRVLSYIRHFKERDKLGFNLNNVMAPDPFDGEHWRTRQELEAIFQREGFKAAFFLHDGDLCKDKPNIYHRLGWNYYYAVLEKKEQ